MKYLLISSIVLIIALSRCSSVPNSKIEDFANAYIENFKNNDFIRMQNVFYAKSGIEYSRLKSAHKNILKILGDIKKVGKGRIIGYDFSFDGNTYELVHDTEFERYKAVYTVKVISRKNNLYIVGWHIDSEGLPQTSYTPAVFDGSVAAYSGEEAADSKKQTAILGSPNPYPDLPHKELIFPLSRLCPSHSPSIVDLPDGGLFAVWYAAAPWSSDTAIWGSTRPASATGWTAPSLIHNTPGLSDNNPVLYLGDDKKLRLFWAVEKGQAKLWLFWAFNPP